MHTLEECVVLCNINEKSQIDNHTNYKQEHRVKSNNDKSQQKVLKHGKVQPTNPALKTESLTANQISEKEFHLYSLLI